MTFLLFGAPVLAALTGRSVEARSRFGVARLGAKVASKPGLTRFLPGFCRFNSAAELPEVNLVEWQGSGDLAALAKSNCFLVVPEGGDGMEPDAIVQILLP